MRNMEYVTPLKSKALYWAGRWRCLSFCAPCLCSMVILYSTPTCVYCNTLKRYFAEKNIQFQEIDVSRDDKELEKMVAISGQMGVPVIDIDGNIVIGFDKNKIDEILKLQ